MQAPRLQLAQELAYTSFPATMTGQVFWFRGTTGYPAVGIYNSVAIPGTDYTDSLIDTPTNYEASVRQ